MVGFASEWLKPRRDMSAFLEYLARARSRVDDALDRTVAPLGTPPPTLHRGMRYSLLAPGKRLRGCLVLASAELCRGEAEVALPLACAVELVHACSLVLDDLPCMDNASLRRGRAVLHAEVGEANAILSSVALLTLAFDKVQQAALRPRVAVTATRRLAAAIGADGLIGGQVADLESTGRGLDLEALEFIHSHKTGALFTAAAELGGMAAGAGERELRALQRFAKNLGLAYQITDDLLDFSGDPSVTGKDAGRDREKTTFVDISGIHGAQRLVDELIDASISALKPFGRRAEVLVAFAELVRARDR